MKLKDMLTPKMIQSSINYYNDILSGKEKHHLPDRDIKKKLEWHVAKYIELTGDLPE